MFPTRSSFDVLRLHAGPLHRRFAELDCPLRPDADVEAEFVAFDRPRIVRVLERIATYQTGRR